MSKRPVEPLECRNDSNRKQGTCHVARQTLPGTQVSLFRLRRADGIQKSRPTKDGEKIAHLAYWTLLETVDHPSTHPQANPSSAQNLLLLDPMVTDRRSSRLVSPGFRSIRFLIGDQVSVSETCRESSSFPSQTPGPRSRERGRSECKALRRRNSRALSRSCNAADGPAPPQFSDGRGFGMGTRSRAALFHAARNRPPISVVHFSPLTWIPRPAHCLAPAQQHPPGPAQTPGASDTP